MKKRFLLLELGEDQRYNPSISDMRNRSMMLTVNTNKMWILPEYLNYPEYSQVVQSFPFFRLTLSCKPPSLQNQNALKMKFLNLQSWLPRIKRAKKETEQYIAKRFTSSILGNCLTAQGAPLRSFAGWIFQRCLLDKNEEKKKTSKEMNKLCLLTKERRTSTVPVNVLFVNNNNQVPFYITFRISDNKTTN